MLDVEVLASGTAPSRPRRRNAPALPPGAVPTTPTHARALSQAAAGGTAQEQQQPADAAPGGGPLPEWLAVRPLGVRVGLLHFEVQLGSVLSEEAVSVVALRGRGGVEEAQQAQRRLAGAPGAGGRLGQMLA